MVVAVVGHQLSSFNTGPSNIPAPTVIQFSFEVAIVNYRGREIDRRQRLQTEYFRQSLGNGVTLDMVSIPGGTFMMGSPASEKGRDSDEGPQHRRTIAPFFMGKFPVTQAQWQAVMNNNPSRWKGEDLPVERVSWNDAVEFCQRLSRQTGREYRLPSEAEWEYACRAGTTTPFHFGGTITTDLANYDGDLTYADGPKGIYRERATPVGSFGVANAFGIYDMHGNVWEWCADPWHKNYQGAPSDGRVWESGGDDSYRMLRGGGWDNDPRYCRSANRSSNGPGNRNYGIGLRVACVFSR
ncbi:MAG: formylglycine-generating enzyme family protein [Hormoscilla sp. GM7CHS1pb]|nr:formylglycine-generating enzyme family protein [Hormoscilla sp. GM7CHS1pb]